MQGVEGDVQRQMRAAAVDLAVQPRRKMEAWQIPCAGFVFFFALLIVGMGTLESRGGGLNLESLGGMDDGGILEVCWPYHSR